MSSLQRQSQEPTRHPARLVSAVCHRPSFRASLCPVEVPHMPSRNLLQASLHTAAAASLHLPVPAAWSRLARTCVLGQPAAGRGRSLRANRRLAAQRVAPSMARQLLAAAPAQMLLSAPAAHHAPEAMHPSQRRALHATAQGRHARLLAVAGASAAAARQRQGPAQKQAAWWHARARPRRARLCTRRQRLRLKATLLHRHRRATLPGSASSLEHALKSRSLRLAYTAELPRPAPLHRLRPETRRPRLPVRLQLQASGCCHRRELATTPLEHWRSAARLVRRAAQPTTATGRCNTPRTSACRRATTPVLRLRRRAFPACIRSAPRCARLAQCASRRLARQRPL